MNRLLLDTHAFVWWLGESPKLRREAQAAIADAMALVHDKIFSAYGVNIVRT